MRRVPFDAAKDVASIAVRVAPLDVGFDLRAHGHTVEIRDDDDRASYADREGRRWVVEGTADDVAAELRRHGYTVERS